MKVEGEAIVGILLDIATRRAGIRVAGDKMSSKAIIKNISALVDPKEVRRLS